MLMLRGSASKILVTMTRPKVLVSNPSMPAIAFEILGTKCDVITSKDDANDILSKVKGVHGIYWASRLPLTKQILDVAGPQMKTVTTISVGYNNIDTAELKARGIKFANCPSASDAAVADVAILLALAASRRLHEGRLHLEEGTWSSDLDFQWLLGQDIEGSTVGIVGFGGIGQTIAKRLKGFDISKLLYTGPKEKAEASQFGAKFVDLDTLIKESDFIFIAAPLSDKTQGMCNKDFFSKMKSTGILINVSRGGLVVQDALVDALKKGIIFAAGLDVMTPEPLPPNHELLKLRNLVLLPHLGSATSKTRNAKAKLAAENMLRGLDGQEMLTQVNL